MEAINYFDMYVNNNLHFFYMDTIHMVVFLQTRLWLEFS